jgi:hypothetical protein
MGLIAILSIAATPMLASAAIPPVTSWAGQGAMAHWTITDTNHGSVVVTIDAVVAQNTGSGSNMMYVNVVHDGTPSESTIYNAVPTTSSMSQITVSATLSFPWGSNSLPHLITITWTPTGPSTPNQYTAKDGTSVNVNGEWRAATASITIGGTGPHPGSFASDWAVIGNQTSSPFPAPEYPVAALGALSAAALAFVCYRAMPKLKTKFA